MSEKIIILVATMGGTAELAADEIGNTLEDHDYDVRVLRMEKASVGMVAIGGTFVFCSSTYGKGDVPDNGQALYRALQEERPDLSGVRYGAVALGDSVYPQTFCFGGKKFDRLLTELGATRIGERLEHDRRGQAYAEDAAADWAESWQQALQKIDA